MVVPEDWRERSANGEVVGEALRRWEEHEHGGYAYSVFGSMRDGGTIGRDEVFGRFAKLGVRNLVVLGDEDDVCSKEQLYELGFRDVEVLVAADHGLVRSRAKEIANLIARFWSGASRE
jgi:pimeloyl-ACP methyl ester carboxylesterase